MGSFDIRAALTGRNYVTAKVQFWLDDKVFYDIAELQAQHTDITDADDPRLAEVEEELQAAEEARDRQAYTLHLRAISNRANEDIISKALAQYPIIRDVYGREDENQQIKRGKFIREMQLAAHMVKVVSPEGDADVVDDENRRDIARAILEEAPPISLSVIDQAIKELNKQFSLDQAKQQDTDFLSKH